MLQGAANNVLITLTQETYQSALAQRGIACNLAPSPSHSSCWHCAGHRARRWVLRAGDKEVRAVPYLQHGCSMHGCFACVVKHARRRLLLCCCAGGSGGSSGCTSGCCNLGSAVFSGACSSFAQAFSAEADAAMAESSADFQNRVNNAPQPSSS